MKRANGSGSVYKLSGNRRNPWVVSVSVPDELFPREKTRKVLGYAPTRDEALKLLLDYNANPYDIGRRSITFEELYYLWLKKYSIDASKSALALYSSAFKHSVSLYEMPISKIRTLDLELSIQACPLSGATKQAMKNLYSLLFKFGIKYDLCERNPASSIDTIKNEAKIKRSVLLNEQILSIKDDELRDLALFGCYTGFRISEILMVTPARIQDGIIVAGVKTKAGRERRVPVHPEIEDIINRRSTSVDKPLFEARYKYYREKYRTVFPEGNLHDTRHTFITNAYLSEMDEYIVKLIVGHSAKDLTKDVYTHIGDDELKKEMLKYKLK